MLILLLIGLLAILGIAAKNVQDKARPILKEEGYKLLYFIRYSDITKFLSNENISDSKKESLRKLVKIWLYLMIGAVVVFILSIFAPNLFPQLR